VERDKAKYKRRQAIVEHPFGTIKRQWDYSYIMTKRGINRASADIGLIFTVYNLRRLFNLIYHKCLREYLRMLCRCFLAFIDPQERISRKFSPPVLSNYKNRISRKFFPSGRIWAYI
jgi:hypothetical protein